LSRRSANIPVSQRSFTLERSDAWKFQILGLLFFLVSVLLAGLFTHRQPHLQVNQAHPAIELSAAVDERFTRATGPIGLSFPLDFGPHLDYQIEWWYYTGNLMTSSGRRFGYQLTFFRRALLPPGGRQIRASAWTTNQVYLAHYAITDIEGESHHSFERTARGSAGLAGAQSPPFRVWLEDWQVEQSADRTYHLTATQGGLALDLALVDQKGVVLHGQQGYSRKGPEPGNASIYFSQTRLASQGSLSVNGETFSVSGSSWMDHEFSTSALAKNVVGWDWFSAQLDDGSELMAFQLRRGDETNDPFSSATIVESDGALLPLEQTDFQITVIDTWKSPHTGAIYPAGWLIQVPSLRLRLELTPYLPDQEMVLRYAYWEGAIKITGERAGEPLLGAGYVELTGYGAAGNKP
jgi:predicted secreted hydrolase